ncbi:isocitrate/isopropylmalate dehydrogenase family protein [Candidatus Uhrbacteria bacterium]|nr:isocitrate/isopropylmalate dehydrogenase family protein [Candidatus Uhrbacteria bacterium]
MPTPYPITVIRGDGTGPELTEVVLKVLEATGVKFQWEILDAGENVMAQYGEPLPNQVVESIKRNKVCLKGPITTPVGKGFRSINVRLRQDLDCFANLRPAKRYAGVRSRYETVDLVIIRENIEDLYAGIEFEQGRSETRTLIETIETLSKKKIRSDSGLSIKPISIFGSERIVRYGFEYARQHGRKKVSLVHKANIMKYTDGLFQSVGERMAQEFPDISFESVIVDNMCMQLVQKPELYDVLVCPNLYGDIISDLASGLVGGLGLTPGANIGHDYAIFEAVHGSAPKYAGQNKVNPAAMILAGQMMLEHLGEREAASRLEAAVVAVIGEGQKVTYDLKLHRDDPTAVGTREMGQAIIYELEKVKVG